MNIAASSISRCLSLWNRLELGKGDQTKEPLSDSVDGVDDAAAHISRCAFFLTPMSPPDDPHQAGLFRIAQAGRHWSSRRRK